jgi:hypothetical protein
VVEVPAALNPDKLSIFRVVSARGVQVYTCTRNSAGTTGHSITTSRPTEYPASRMPWVRVARPERRTRDLSLSPMKVSRAWNTCRTKSPNFPQLLMGETPFVHG